MNQKVKHLIQKLGEAIHETVSESEDIAGVVKNIREQGFDVLFTNTHKMLQHLNGGRADGSFERRLAGYVRPQVLILDDFGLRALTPPSPEDMYEIIAERYETGSIMLTSNRAPSEWPELSGNDETPRKPSDSLSLPLFS